MESYGIHFVQKCCIFVLPHVFQTDLHDAICALSLNAYLQTSSVPVSNRILPYNEMYEFTLQMLPIFLLTALSFFDPELVYDCIFVYKFNFIILLCIFVFSINVNYHLPSIMLMLCSYKSNRDMTSVRGEVYREVNRGAIFLNKS